jgi:hypothetical protein
MENEQMATETEIDRETETPKEHCARQASELEDIANAVEAQCARAAWTYQDGTRDYDACEATRAAGARAAAIVRLAAEDWRARLRRCQR